MESTVQGSYLQMNAALPVQIPFGACQQYRSGSEPAKALIFIFSGIDQKGIKMDQVRLKMGQEGLHIVFWT